MTDSIILAWFEPYLYKDEKIIQTFKPDVKAYFFSKSLLSYFAGCIGGIALFLWFIHLEKIQYDIRSAYFIPLFICLWCAPKLLNQIANYRNTGYAYSNERVFFCTGIFSKKIEAFDYNKIKTIVAEEENGMSIYKPGSIRFYLKYTEKIDKSYESIVYTWQAIAHCTEIKQLLNTQLEKYVLKHGDEFVPNEDERKLIHLQTQVDKIDTLLKKLDKEEDDESFTEPAKDKSEFPPPSQWLTCDICGYDAFSVENGECQICYSQSFENENEDGEYANKKEWLASEQLDYFSEQQGEQNIFYKPKILRGFTKSTLWNPYISYQDVLNYRNRTSQ